MLKNWRSKLLDLAWFAGYRYDSKEMLAPFEYKGYTDQYLFGYWFEHMLCPNFKS